VQVLAPQAVAAKDSGTGIMPKAGPGRLGEARVGLHSPHLLTAACQGRL